jgi:diadenosine tetraphosphate (Ap4A) HIT family hydrolase
VAVLGPLGRLRTMTRLTTTAPIYTNDHFKVEACSSCYIPGYVIVSPKSPANTLSDISSDALALLGPTLAVVTKAITEVVGAERVYCCLFSEKFRLVHFHVFPRTTQLLSEYKREHPDQSEVSGPLILDWAYHRFDRSLAELKRDTRIYL